MKSFLVLLAMLLALTACQKAQDKDNGDAKIPSKEGAAAIDSETEQETVMPDDDGIWTVNLDFAKKIAEENNIKLLILFTGSDWCGWCKKLDEEVFSKELFQQEVVKMFVPVKLDFPRGVRFPKEIADAYNAEMNKYGVEGFPTVVLADSDGAAFAVTGYRPGGEEAYLDMLKDVLDARKELDAKAAELKDGDEAAANDLCDALRKYSARFQSDPCVKAGLKKYYDICKEKCPEISRALEREEKIMQRLDEISERYKMGEGYDSSEATPEKVDQAAAEYQAVIDSFKLEGEMKQEVLMKIALLYAIVQEDDKLQSYVDQAIEAAPESELALSFKEQRRIQEVGEMLESVTQMIIDDKKDDALKAVDAALEIEEDPERKVMLTGMKAEIRVLFDDIEDAKGDFEKCIEMCDDAEEAEQFKVRLGELDPFNKTVTQSQLFAMRGNPKEMADAIEKAIEQYNPDPASLQKALVMQAQAYMEARDEAKANETIKKAIDVDPETDLAKELSENLKRMEEMQAAMQNSLQERKTQIAPRTEDPETQK